MTNKGKTGRAIKIVSVCLVAAAVLTLALLQYFLPFRALLPPYRISPKREGELRLHFLYVGQADCTLVEYPNGEVVVIDAGGGSWEANNTLVRYLKGLAPTKVNLVLTHADFDHYGGAEDLLKVFSVDTFYLPYRDTDDDRYVRMLRLAEQKNCKREHLTRYATINEESGFPLVCISPRMQEWEKTEENDLSTVLYLDCCGVRTVFSGDISSSREELLAYENGLLEGIFDSGDYPVRLENIDILKVSHHGSGSATSGWAELVNPRTAIISCGRGNRYSHPAESAVHTLSALTDCQIYRTDELGNIVISILDGKYSVVAKNML